jgi:hypothetical protein
MCQKSVEPRDVSMLMHGKPYKYGILEDCVPEGHLVEHTACILHAPTFCNLSTMLLPTKTYELLSIICSWTHYPLQVHLHWFMHSTLPQRLVSTYKLFYCIYQNSSRSRLKIWSNISFITHCVDQILIKTLGRRLVGMHTRQKKLSFSIASNNPTCKHKK